MKKLAILLIASTFAIACPFLTACDGGEEEEILAPDNNENTGNGNQDKVDVVVLRFGHRVLYRFEPRIGAGRVIVPA